MPLRVSHKEESITGNEYDDQVLSRTARQCLELMGSGRPFGAKEVQRLCEAQGVKVDKVQAIAALELANDVAAGPELVHSSLNCRPVPYASEFLDFGI